MDSYDVIIVGTGAGGGTLLRRLAPSGLRILVLERGQVVERGTHAELLARDGLYRKLHDIQTGEGRRHGSRHGGSLAEPLTTPTGVVAG